MHKSITIGGIKSAVHEQGKVVAEYHKLSNSWIVIFPNGITEFFWSRSQVEAAAKRYFKRHVRKGAVGVGRIEWRT